MPKRGKKYIESEKKIAAGSLNGFDEAVKMALELPDTIMEAVRRELLHLWDNAFEIIAHGVNLHRTDILSDREIKQVVSENTRPIEIDIDEQYERNVKVLYGAIVAYISEASSKIPAEYSEDLYALRLAGQNIIEAVKDVKHLRKNLETYMVSDNPYVKEEYDLFRFRLATQLKLIVLLFLFLF